MSNRTDTFVILKTEDGMMKVGNNDSIESVKYGTMKMASVACGRTHIIHSHSVLYAPEVAYDLMLLSQAPKKNFEDVIGYGGNEH